MHITRCSLEREVYNLFNINNMLFISMRIFLVKVDESRTYGVILKYKIDVSVSNYHLIHFKKKINIFDFKYKVSQK